MILKQPCHFTLVTKPTTGVAVTLAKYHYSRFFPCQPIIFLLNRISITRSGIYCTLSYESLRHIYLGITSLYICCWQITNLYMVPPLMVFLAKHPLVRQYDLSSVREIVCGAAPLSREVIEEVRTRLPQAEIRQGYGMTESTIVITISPPNANKSESVGLLAPGCLAKVCIIISDLILCVIEYLDYRGGGHSSVV